VFDLMVLQGKDVVGETLEARRGLLETRLGCSLKLPEYILSARVARCVYQGRLVRIFLPFRSAGGRLLLGYPW
jgi:hypothetical protein